MSFSFLFFDANITFSRLKVFIADMKKFSKQNVGAIVYNNTNQTLEITDYKYIHQLPPGSNSKDIGIFDADSLVINEPMYFEDKLYSNGVLRFCDYAKLEIEEVDGIAQLKAKNIWVCKILNDFNFYNSIEEAFH